MNHYITGHDLVQAKPTVAPLDMTFAPGDAELLATCATAVEELRTKNGTSPTNEAVSSLEDELKAQGFVFFGSNA
jgi:hypothetical protein